MPSRPPVHRPGSAPATSPWQKRPSTGKRITGRALQARNKRIKDRDGWRCQRCQAISITLQVDHRIPVAAGGSDEDDNLQSLCLQCHQEKSAQEAQFTSYLPEWLPPPLIPVIAVAGPPGAGKSRHVLEHAGKGDQIIDVDVIAVEITGKPMYWHSSAEIATAIRVRNERLASLGRPVGASRFLQCWLVVTASTPIAMAFWKQYATQVVVLDPGPEECERRIRADVRRPAHVVASHIAAVHAWGKPKAIGLKASPVGVDGLPVGWHADLENVGPST